MITLRNKLYESLLDDEDEIINDDKGIAQTILNDLTSDFYKEYDNKRIVKDKAYLENNTVIFNDSIKLSCTSNNNHKSIPEYLPGVNSIKVNGAFLINPLRGLDILDDKYICKNLSADRIVFDLRGTHKIKNINISITDKHVGGNNHVNILDPIGRESLHLENININANLPWMIIYMDTDNMPQFKNVNINGCKQTYLKIYSLGLGEKGYDITEKINSLLDIKYKSEIYDNKKLETVSKKSDIKSMQAIINNSKRYKIMSDLFRVKPGANLSSLFGNIPKNITSINISNNICSVVFERDPDNLIKQRLPFISNILSDGWSMRIIDK